MKVNTSLNAGLKMSLVLLKMASFLGAFHTTFFSTTTLRARNFLNYTTSSSLNSVSFVLLL